MTKNSAMAKKNQLQYGQVLQWIALLIVSILAIFLSVHFQDRLLQFKSLGFLGIFLINFFSAATIFFPSPAIATVIAGGAIYPPVIVGLVATLGATLGDMVGYFLGLSSSHILLKKKHNWYDALVSLFKKYGGIMVFLFAMIPNPIFDAVSIIAGALGYSPYKFFLWLFLGRLVRNMALAFIGARF
jgi:membrane protein YqaA with SNARE-associated domain